MLKHDSTNRMTGPIERRSAEFADKHRRGCASATQAAVASAQDVPALLDANARLRAALAEMLAHVETPGSWGRETDTADRARTLLGGAA